LQVQQQGVEVAGHNLANVNNPAYTRQRIDIATTDAINSPIGQFGTGADVVAIRQLRSTFLDSQIQSESSVRGFLDAQQSALQYSQAALGESVERQAGTLGTADATASDSQSGIGQQIADLFHAF